MPLRIPKPCFLALCLPALAQEGGTFYEAYADGLAAMARGDFGTAISRFQRAIALEPRPGNKVKTYGVNFIAYHPYLRLAESALAAGNPDLAAKALADSARIGLEPSGIRAALQQRLDQLRTTAKAPEPRQEAKPEPKPGSAASALPKVEAPKPAPLHAPASRESGAETVRLPGPEARKEAADPKKGAAPVADGREAKLPATQASPPPATPSSASPAAPAPVASAPAPEPRPAPPPFPWALTLGLASLGLLGLGAARWSRRRSKAGRNTLRVTQGSNPYRVDLEANTSGQDDATLRSNKRLSGDAEQLNRHVGPYVIVKTLGRGGCATTFLAVHEKDGTEVAVKIPHPHIIVDHEFLARFRREAELGTVLEHPRIVRILDPGPKEGDAWIAMSLVRGTTLEGYLGHHKGPMPLAETTHIASDVAEAIAFAHSKGVVHRDLKPANIMLGENGAIVMDFGIARLTDSAMTATGIFIGTPNYAAPEAITNPRVGPPADRYALGIILFELLTGSVPFTGETGFQVLDQHRSAPLPDIRALRPDAPPSLLRLVERLCAKRPEERPEDGEVLQILTDLKVKFPLEIEPI
ncbi:MAG: protein kinase [Acidobacteriota bacterium]|nr:protein kinase [Acidobacteriota bacterium]